MKYKCITGKTVEVIETGKSFKTVTKYPATKHSPTETVTRKHKTWCGVERIIKNMTEC